jgi:hypothetical protein
MPNRVGEVLSIRSTRTLLGGAARRSSSRRLPCIVKPQNRMRYQLVLQFRKSAFVDLDAIVALEDNLIGQLAGFADVDGHDFGSREANLFVLTSNPTGSFGAIRPALERAGLLSAVTVAYRPINGDGYTVLWPEQSDKIFRVA